MDFSSSELEIKATRIIWEGEVSLKEEKKYLRLIFRQDSPDVCHLEKVFIFSKEDNRYIPDNDIQAYSPLLSQLPLSIFE